MALGEMTKVVSGDREKIRELTLSTATFRGQESKKEPDLGIGFGNKLALGDPDKSSLGRVVWMKACSLPLAPIAQRVLGRNSYHLRGLQGKQCVRGEQVSADQEVKEKIREEVLDIWDFADYTCEF